MHVRRRDEARGSWRGATALLALVVLAVSGCSRVVDLEPPHVADLERRPPEQSLVYDADGNRIGVLRTEFRDRVPLGKVPEHLQDAVVAAEDQRFWTHSGVDLPAIARAAAVNAARGEVEQGGSTITQQLVKNLYMPDAARTFETKAREALLARDVEREYSKEQILEEYLNTVYFGSGAYGIQAAAYTYFRKNVDDLTLPEAALLAGIIRAPSSLDPHRNRDAARARRDHVLTAMEDLGLVSETKAERARAQPVSTEPRPPAPTTDRPYWLDFVVRTLVNDPDFGEDETERASRLYGGGLRIHTTLRPRTQDAAEAVVDRFFPNPDDPEVAIVTVDPATGAILASVGGRDHAQRQFDLATQGRRQPGSTFKTFVLTTALNEGWRPDDRVNGDEATLRFGDAGRFEVDNYDDRDYGDITLDTAIRNSVNAAFARLIFDVGTTETAATAHALGIRSEIGDHPAIALGGLSRGVTPLEMTAAYATIANAGRRVTPTPIDRIEDSDGNVIWRPRQAAVQVVDPGVAWVVTQMLRGVVEHGTGVHARLPRWEVAGKTGTTTDYVDAWFVGYTPTLATAVWMGYPEGNDRPLHGIGGERVVTGGSWPARMWREYMTAALDGERPQGFVLPEGAGVEVRIDPETGLLAAPWCEGEARVVPRLLVPTERCPSPPPSPTPEPTDGPDAQGAQPCPSVGPTPAPTWREPECPASAAPSPSTVSTTSDMPPATGDPRRSPSATAAPSTSPSGDRASSATAGDRSGAPAPSPSPTRDEAP